MPREAKTAESATWPTHYAKCFHVTQVKSLCDWSDRNIFLPATTNRESGKWDTSRTPYIRGPMESFLLPYVRQSTMMAATQTGKTQGHLFNPILFTIAEKPLPTALIYPNENESKAISETRLQPLIKACPATASQILEDQDLFKLRRMTLNGMTLSVLSAGILAEAKQKQLCVIGFDEIEAYTGFQGKSAAEGDVINIYMERAKGFWDIRKILISSSRVFVGGPIDKCLEESEVVFKWVIKCPHCNEWEPLSRDLFYYEDLGDGVLNKARLKAARESAYFVCPSCGGKITDEHKA